jgi:hypothetical protein
MIGKVGTRKMNESNFIFNNEAISTVCIGYFLSNLKVVSIPKILLVLPFVLHEQTVKKLRNNSLKRSLEEFILKNPEVVSNFNARFIDFLPLSVNSLTILRELNVIRLDRDFAYLNGNNFHPDYDRNIGDRMKNIFKAIDVLSELMLESDVNSFYLNLKIEL